MAMVAKSQEVNRISGTSLPPEAARRSRDHAAGPTELTICKQEVTGSIPGAEVEDPIFPPGEEEPGKPYTDLRWSRFKHREPGDMFQIVGERVFLLPNGSNGW
jgi:hypothetical protein